MKICLLVVIIVGLTECSRHQQPKYPYAIKDFRQALQPVLTQMVGKTFVYTPGEEPELFPAPALTDEELTRLSRCEHPVLRAIALRAMINRKSFNAHQVLMSHLDDTAMVWTYQGEFTEQYKRVTDDLIAVSTWQTKEEKMATIDAVLLNHNYLASAYTIASRVDTQQKYYAVIRQMVTRDRPAYELDNALYGLAKYRVKEDIPLIKKVLLYHAWKLSSPAFRLIKDFPDDAYLEVLARYRSRVCIEGLEDEYFSTLASYKNAAAAQELGRLLNMNYFTDCVKDTNEMRRSIAQAVWSNPCAAYTPLISQIRKKLSMTGNPEQTNVKYPGEGDLYDLSRWKLYW